MWRLKRRFLPFAPRTTPRCTGGVYSVSYISPYCDFTQFLPVIGVSLPPQIRMSSVHANRAAPTHLEVVGAFTFDNVPALLAFNPIRYDFLHGFPPMPRHSPAIPRTAHPVAATVFPSRPRQADCVFRPARPPSLAQTFRFPCAYLPRAA